MARRMAATGAPTHGIMAQGRWKTARMVEVYSRAEEAGPRRDVTGLAVRVREHCTSSIDCSHWHYPKNIVAPIWRHFGEWMN